MAMRFISLTVIITHGVLLSKMQTNCFIFPMLNNSKILTSMTQDLIKKPTAAPKNNYLLCRCGRWCYIN